MSVLTFTICKMKEVLRYFAGQTSYGFLFGQVIPKKAVCESFQLLRVTWASRMNHQSYFSPNSTTHPQAILGLRCWKGVNSGLLSF